MSEPEQNFDELQKLIGCKRYEQPPPGYFLSFSDKVIARIEAEDAAGYSSWWSWFADRFDAKPVVVCAYGLAVSGLLLLGFRLSQVFEAEVAAAPIQGGPWLAVTPASSVLLPQELTQTGYFDSPVSSVASRRYALREEPGRLFFPGSGLHVQPVSLAFPGH